MEEARRQALQSAVGALCVEAGFMSAERDALGALSEIMQSCKQTIVLFLNNARHNMFLLFCVRYNGGRANSQGIQ